MDVDVAWWGGLYEGWWAQLPMAMPPYVPWEGSKCLPSALHHHPFLFSRSNQHVRIFAVILYLQILLTRGLLFLCCRDRCSLCKCCSGLVNRWWLMFMWAQWRMFFNPLKSLKRQMSHRSLWLKWILISIMNAFFWPFLFQEVLLMDTTVKVLWLFSPVFRFHIKYVLNGK